MREQIGYFIERVYQQKRIHSSLGYVTPEEFELQWKSVHSHHEIPLSKGFFVSSFMSPVHSIMNPRNETTS